MALINRFSRLFRADLHAVLDRIEEPEVLLRQSVREMEQSLLDDQRNLKVLEHDLAGLPTLISETEQQLVQVQDEISLCLDNANDKLARSKVKRKLELQQRNKRLHSRQSAISEEVNGLREQVNNHQHRLESMRQKLEIFSQQSNQLEQSYVLNGDTIINDDDVDVALLREKQVHGKQSGGGK